MHTIADAAATLGSRFNLIFLPGANRVCHTGYGEFREQPFELTAGIRTAEGEVYSLPFSRTASHLERLDHVTTLTTVEYRGVHRQLGLAVGLKVRAPFYPQDEKLSTAPFFYVDLSVRRMQESRGATGEGLAAQGYLVLELHAENLPLQWQDSRLSYRFQSTSRVQCDRTDHPAAGSSRTSPVMGWLQALDDSRATEAGFEKRFELSPGDTCTMGLLWWGWAPDPVTQVFGDEAPFKYRDFFDSPGHVAEWAVENRDDIEAKCDFLDRTAEGWSLGAASSNLAATGLHAFLANTWWASRGRRKDWFAVSEGARHYLSPVGVEYNNALFYLSLWPELLGMLLDQWAEFELEGSELLGGEAQAATYLAHDMGSQFYAEEPCYHHPTPIETNADYLLLLAAKTAWSGDLSTARDKLPLCRRLAEFIFKCDTTGNGLPDLCTANALDDAGPALQFGRDQTYLAVKAQAALTALAEVEEACAPSDSKAERWRAFVAKGVKTLDAEGWLGDHYPVTLPTETGDADNPWTGETLPHDKLKGWDDYSIYTGNGLLYLCLANLRQPHWRKKRLAKDVENADRRCRTPYGCTHTATCDSSVWISQNICKDFVAAYLGIDLLNNVERYWDYQVVEGADADGSLYCDSTAGDTRRFHPTGVTILGAPVAAAGLRLNRIEGELFLSPIRTTLDVPLLPFADWERRRIPWLRVRQQEGVATARISNGDLLEGLTVEMVGAELEKA